MKIPWSYSLLNTAENCLRKAHHIYWLKDLPREDSEALRWGIRVHDALEKRINDGKPLPEELKDYERFAAPLKIGKAEIKCGIRQDGTKTDFFAKDVWGRGKVDAAFVDANKALIVDWKTGKVREDPDELEIGAVLLKAMFPQIDKIMGWYVWLKDKKMGKMWDLSDTATKLPQIRERVARIEDAERTGHFPPQQNPLCGWCPVKTCEFHP